jgi:lipopolysaccharide biosynthesis glycosyltransferase
MGQRPDNGEIVIATCVDDSYLPLVWPLARSIGLANGFARPSVLHVFHDGADHELAARLNGLRVLRLRVVVHATKTDATGLGRAGGLPPTTYLRLHLPDLLPHEAKVIYLDTDTMAVRSLGALFDADLGGNPLGAVQDILQARPSVRFKAPGFDGSMSEYCPQFLGIPYDPERFSYVNSGVLVMDLAQLRREGFVERALQRSRELAHTTLWHDQDALNSLMAGRTTFLAGEWNVMPDGLLVEIEGSAQVQDIFRQQQKRQSIIHFAGPTKPWRFAPVPFAVRWQLLALFSPATRLMKWPGLKAYFVSRRISFGRRLARTNPRIFAFAFGLWKLWRRRAA